MMKKIHVLLTAAVMILLLVSAGTAFADDEPITKEDILGARHGVLYENWVLGVDCDMNRLSLGPSPAGILKKWALMKTPQPMSSLPN